LTFDPGLKRAIAALKAGRPVRIDGERQITILSVETADAETLSLHDPRSRAPVLISGWRAAALSLANRREAADPSDPVLIERAPWLDPESARALADAGQDADRAPVGPLAPIASDKADEERLALKLARLAGLLPALWVIEPVANST